MTLTGFSQMKGYKEERRDTKEGREGEKGREWTDRDVQQ